MGAGGQWLRKLGMDSTAAILRCSEVHRIPFYQITGALSLIPAGSLLKIFRRINKHCYAQFTHVSRQPGDLGLIQKVKP